MSANKTILICRCAERNLLEPAELEKLAGLEEAVVIPDLCRAAQERDPFLAEIVQSDHAEIHACHARAVRSLFAFSGNPLPASASVHNHRRKGSASPPESEPGDKPPAWYPLIDYDRCSRCGQCFEFCLFGVYGKDPDGRIRVVNPESCKNNCPACARICPEAAIIFPKSAETPINGTEIDDEAAVRANIKVNVDEILGDDVYAALRARKEKRQSLLNRKKIDRALEERRKCSGDRP
ncbi:MAG: ferredoxin family protein [Pontiellaceae bacterium]|nr:ferredoxin family protein [Pontiellaceae bacterium]